MPTHMVKIGNKSIKMPLLDIERVVKLEGRVSFKQNIVGNVDDQSLASESIMKSTAKGED